MMLKKGLLGLAVAALLGTFVLGREAVSYVRAGCQNVRNAVKEEVPIEFEIERARTMVDQLIPDIRQCMHVVAEQQVRVFVINDFQSRVRSAGGWHGKHDEIFIHAVQKKRRQIGGPALIQRQERF